MFLFFEFVLKMTKTKTKMEIVLSLMQLHPISFLLLFSEAIYFVLILAHFFLSLFLSEFSLWCWDGRALCFSFGGIFKEEEVKIKIVKIVINLAVSFRIGILPFRLRRTS